MIDIIGRGRPLALAVILAALAAYPAAAVMRVDPGAALQKYRAGWMPNGARTMAPFGAIVFCDRFRSQCAVRKARGQAIRDGRLVAGPATFSLLESVNAGVNRRIHAVAESRAGNADVWAVGPRSGDCEDFALTKRDQLIRSGLPSSAVLVATARASRGPHAVLIVRTDRGDFVLDNLTAQIKPFRAVGYRWDKVQSPADPRVWNRL